MSYEYDRDTVALDLQNTCTHTLHVCEVFDVIEGCREKVENLHAITSLSHTGELSPQGCAIAIAILGRRPPGFFWLFAIGELVSNKPCVILAASW